MNREDIRHMLSGILMDTGEEHPIKCSITIGEEEAVGVSTNELPLVTSIFQQPSEGIIWFNIEGCSEPMEFDDLSDYDLEKTIKYFEYIDELPR